MNTISLPTSFSAFGLVVCCGLISLQGCSDPAAPAPEAAFIGTFNGGTCAAKNPPGPNVGIGDRSGPTLVTDGDNATVSCRVAKLGANTYDARVHIANSSTSFDINVSGIGPANGPGNLASATVVAVSSPSTAGGMYIQSNTDPCKVTFLEGEAGRIAATFYCNTMTASNGSPSEICGISQGWVSARNCTTQ